MCGICGLVTKNTKSETIRTTVSRMTHILSHRGPDNEGYFFGRHGEKSVGLGHRRLSIIDLSEKANQPMANEDDTLCIVCNGEIYNYRKLREELLSAGHVLCSQSDTEVILHLYEDMGKACLDRLDGMFAFGIWDKTRGSLFLARDRLGIKPLFYSFKNGSFCFASEIKALLKVPGMSRQLDLKALDCYLTYGYIPGSMTIFKDIRKLPPASCLKLENDKLRIEPYWTLEYLPKHSMPLETLQEELLELLKESVNKHCICDVPLGAFLSGGVDSSIVVALMSMTSSGGIDTFSLGCEEGGEDELEYAEAVAKRYETRHQVFKVEALMTQVLPNILWHLDEPFFDNSIIPSYCISLLARKKIKVALSGDGGDEIFGGYEWARRHQYSEALKWIPLQARKALTRMVRIESPEGDFGTSLRAKAGRFFCDLSGSVEEGFLRRTSVSKPFRLKVYSQGMIEELKGFDAADYRRDLFRRAVVEDTRERMLFTDTMSYLPDDCLFKVDRMSMAHGLELRVPFLDRKLVEFAARIPFQYKIRGFTSKYILKKTFAPFLPKKILRQRKQGFTIPISSWLRDELKETARRILLSETLEKRGLFVRSRLQWMLDAHAAGKQELGHRLWSLIVFEVWARLYLDLKVEDAPGVSFEEVAQ